MAITNIDTKEYEQLYEGIDSNPLIRAFQTFKLNTIFPILRLANKDSRCIDIGCAKGNFLNTLKKYGYKSLSGLDLKNALYPQLKSAVVFYETSICAENFEIRNKFDNVFVQAMLHHLPPGSLKKTAQNLHACLEKDGRLFIYEPNMASWIGKFFYFYFLRLFPRLYRATMLEKPDQLAFCKNWPDFLSELKRLGMYTVKSSEFSFYKIYIGEKRS